MIDGLRYTKNFIYERQCKSLLMQINESKWTTKDFHHAQDYGFVYDQNKRFLTDGDFSDNLPRWAKSLSALLYDNGYLKFVADQVTVDMYLKNEGVDYHIDIESCYENQIAVLTLAEPTVLMLKNENDDKFKIGHTVKLLLEPYSLLVIDNAARFLWSHSIPKTEYTWNGNVYQRKPYISITFRKAIEPFYQIDDEIVFLARSLGGSISDISNINEGNNDN